MENAARYLLSPYFVPSALLDQKDTMVRGKPDFSPLRSSVGSRK